MDIEHLLVFPGRDVAEEVADALSDEGLHDVRVVREALAGEDDAEDHEWAVYVRTPDDRSYAARFATITADHGGWYDPNPTS